MASGTSAAGFLGTLSRLSARRKSGYSTQDIEHILLRGKITNKEFKDKTQSWAYTIKGDDLEGEEGGVVTVIISSQACVIITVLG